MVGQRNFPPPLLVLLLDTGSGMDKNQDPGKKNLSVLNVTCKRGLRQPHGYLPF